MIEKLLAAGAQSVYGCIDYRGKNLGRIVGGEFVPLPGAEEDIQALLDNIIDMEPAKPVVAKKVAAKKAAKPAALPMAEQAEPPAELDELIGSLSGADDE